MQDIRDAIEAAKKISQQFSAFQQIADKADALLALVNHEDELKTKIVQLQADIVGLETRASDARVAEEQRTAVAKANGDRTIREYEEKIAAIDTELRQAKDGRQARINNEVQLADRAIGQIKAAFEAEKTKIEASYQAITAEHEAFIEQTKEHRAKIEANTKALEDKQAELRAELAPLMKE